MRVKLTPDEKKELGIQLAKHLPKLRKMLGLSQQEWGERCGMSRNRIIEIEKGSFVMTWSQFTSFLLVLSVNRISKQYLLDNQLFPAKLYQYLQLKEENEAPDLYIAISEAAIMNFQLSDKK